MPLMIALPYMLIEALAFFAVAKWLGVGTALLLLIACFFLGLFLAAFEMRGIARKLAAGQRQPGQAAGDIGLTAAGAVGVAMPGFVTTIIGLLLILPPTRALVRRSLAKKLRAKVEDLGVRSFEATNAYRQRASYGSFSGQVVDAAPDSASDAPQQNPQYNAQRNAQHDAEREVEEFKRWSDGVNPEDFGKPRND